MEYRWKEVWNNRTINHEEIHETDEFKLYKKLKRLDGFDVVVSNEDGYYRTFYDEFLNTYKSYIEGNSSVYEVGCGGELTLFS